MKKLEGIKEGDTVEVSFRGRIQWVSSDGAANIAIDGGSPCASGFSAKDTSAPSFSIRKVEPPIAVGDRVRVVGTSKVFEVVGPPRANSSGAEIVAVYSEGFGYGLYGAISLERVS